MEKVLTKESKAKSNTVYRFEYGLPGFENLSEFEFQDLDDFPPFKLFQSTEIPDISMIVIDGSLLSIYQDIPFPKHELINLKIEKSESMRIFVILRIDEKSKHFLANTKAPLVLNTHTGCGKQVILDSPKLSEEYKLDQL
jgi:flagellar assembly factor FliW